MLYLFKKTFALFLAVVFVISVCGCNTTRTEKVKHSNNDDSTATNNETPENTDEFYEEPEIEYEEDFLFGDNNDNLNFYEDFDDEQIEDYEQDHFEDLDDTEEIASNKARYETDYDENYKNPVQAYGKKISGSKRTIKVQTDNPVWLNFHGFGANYFCQTYTKHNYGNLKYTQASFALDAERYTSDAAHIARLWFDVDFMVTSEQKEIPKDYRDNIDYQNYMNGIYDFESEQMQSFWSYMNVWKEAGTDIAINFGWKVDDRIQSWFSIPGVAKPHSSAPYDLAAYSKAAVALLNEVERRGYDNATKYITFYNEPAEIDQTKVGDFVTLSENKAYYASMMRYIDKAFKESGWDKKIEVWTLESGRVAQGTTEYTDYIYQTSKNHFDTMALHIYGNEELVLSGAQEYGSNNSVYSAIYTVAEMIKNSYRQKNIYITEYYNCPSLETYDESYVWRDWNASNAGYFIAASNCGIGATLKWITVGGYNCRKSNLYLVSADLGHYGVAVDNLYEGHTTNDISVDTYFDLLAIWYIPDGSDVLMQTWTGRDIKVSAYKYKDDYTVLVEANKSKLKSRELNIKFNNNLGGKTFYRYTFNPLTQKCNGNGTVPTSDKIIKNVSKSFSDKINGDYACYFYSTIKPIKQVEVEDISIYCKKNESINIKARMIDCSTTDKLKYKVVAKSVCVGETVAKEDLGTVSNSGVYTPPSSAKSGDYFAVKAYLENDTSVHAIALVYIK